MAQRIAERHCLTCKRFACTRGLCNSCFVSARRAIRRGEIAERDAVARGLMLPKRKAGRPRLQRNFDMRASDDSLVHLEIDVQRRLEQAAKGIGAWKFRVDEVFAEDHGAGPVVDLRLKIEGLAGGWFDEELAQFGRALAALRKVPRRPCGQ
jgi:hypothetical protein